MQTAAMNEMTELMREISHNDPAYLEEEFITTINLNELDTEVATALLSLYSASKKISHNSSKDNLHAISVLIKYNIHNNTINTYLLAEVNKLKAKMKSKLFTVKNLVIFAGMIISFMMVVWFAYLIDKEATTYVMGLLGDTWSHVEKFVLSKLRSM